MAGEPIVIYSAASTQQAHLLKGLLAEQGIAAWVVNDAIQFAGGDLPLGWAAAARVVVGEENAIEARRLAEDFDRQTAHEPTDDDPAADGVLDQWDDWPVCPKCGERRSARCPACLASGTSFPLADIQETADGQRVFLLCKDCGDHFLPEWFRLCPRCGYDFGGGIEIDPPQPTTWPTVGLRSVIVLALLLGAAAAISAYFLWLFGWRAG
jgi:hypothetical protein